MIMKTAVLLLVLFSSTVRADGSNENSVAGMVKAMMIKLSRRWLRR